MPAFRYAVVTTTTVNRSCARRLANGIVRSRLGACVQSFPIHSTYWWKGKLESASEQMLLIKTRAGHVRRLMKYIREHHDYEVPEIVVLPVGDGSPSYLDWIRRETGGAV